MLFIFGLGYVGQHVGRSLMTKGWSIAGTTRTSHQADELKERGISATIWDGATPLGENLLEGVTHILVTVPPDEKGDVVLRRFDFSTLPSTVKWIGYVSATSVYGDHQGAWVTESSSVNPVSPQGCHRLRAETQWMQVSQKSHALPLHIFRLSGIYGPARSVLDRIQRGIAQRIGAPKDKPEIVFSRIHIDDIVTTLEASMTNPQPGEIYNLADDEPATTADVIAYACKLLGQDVPPLVPFEQAALSADLQKFYGESKRVSNHKIKNSLGVRLAYPTYREGVKALVNADK